MRMCHFQTQNGPFIMNKFFLVQTIIITFIYHFHYAKFKKILTEDPELWGCTIFGPKIVHLPQTNFFWKIINIILIYLLAPFIGQNLKKILSADPEFLGPKWPISPSENFFSEKLLMSLNSFIHAYLHAKNQILIY